MTSSPELSGWVEASLGDFLQLNYGKSLPKRRRTGQGFPVYGSNGIIDHHSSALTQGETLIIGRKGSAGAVNYSPGACFPIDTTYYLDQFHGMPSRYWFYLLEHLKLGNLDKATAIPGLNREDAYQVVIQVAPLFLQICPETKFSFSAKTKRVRWKYDTLILRRMGQRLIPFLKNVLMFVPPFPDIHWTILSRSCKATTLKKSKKECHV